jgi:hypothetical protein
MYERTLADTLLGGAKKLPLGRELNSRPSESEPVPSLFSPKARFLFIIGEKQLFSR